ncbi:AbrB/MazE/SpoVT family DNA-binding domain-containing protein [Candidatus Nomurabacteria bacterium]|nr:AbrB/MazE/SpoVT family DNA-binding domain-containing protein [Candidatus Nomurabacteria bacterium]
MARPDNDNTSLRFLSMVGKKSYAVSLPIEIIRVLGWKKGSQLMVRRQGKKIVIERVD